MRQFGNYPIFGNIAALKDLENING